MANSLSCRKPASFLLSSKSWISFWVWFTLSISFRSIPWYWLRPFSKRWKVSLSAWISFIFSEIIPFIRSIYFVKFIYFCLYILSYSWIWLNVFKSFSRLAHFLSKLSAFSDVFLTALFKRSISFLHSCFWFFSFDSSLSMSASFFTWGYNCLTFPCSSLIWRIWVLSWFYKFFLSCSTVPSLVMCL